MTKLEQPADRDAPSTVARTRRAGRSLTARLMASAAIVAVLGTAAFIHVTRADTQPLVQSNRAASVSSDTTVVGLPTFTALVQQVKPAVVSVRVKADAEQKVVSDSRTFNPFEGTPFEKFFKQIPDPYGQESPWGRHRYVQGQGSGFFISADGYIVTNNHVVAHAVKVEVVTDDNRTLQAKVVGTDPKTDLALLKVDGENGFPFVTLAKEAPKIGQWVVAMGNPFGLGGTVTAGIVSAQGRDIGNGPYNDFIQIDAAVNRGNSGGPTFNMKGEVIGVNTAIYSPSGGSVGIAFAIPASTLQTVIPQLKEDGHVERGWLGVQVQPVTKEIADSLGLNDAKGALIAEPQAGSPAAEAGLRSGDVVTHVAGDEIKDSRDLARSIATLKPGSSTTLTIRRNGKTDTVNITIGRLADQQHQVARHDTSGEDQYDRLGLAVRPARQVEGAGDQGLAVLGVDPEGQAAELGFAAGDVILKAGGKTVASAEDLMHAMAEAKDSGKGHTLVLVKRNDSARFVAVPVSKS